jgi:hypothetical protein
MNAVPRKNVIPAKAGIQGEGAALPRFWIPALAGTTADLLGFTWFQKTSSLLFLFAFAAFSISIRDGRAFDSSAFDSILEEAVENGVVDYAKIEGRYGDLQAYLHELEKADIDTMSPEEKMAFYINAFNAHCINGVLSKGEIDSVNDVPPFFKGTRFVLAGKEMNLDSLEHEVLRPLGDPRIHFAIVHSSSSSPKLASRAYRGETLEEDLVHQAESFFRDPAKNRLDREAGVFRLSKILKWFLKDFTQEAPSLLAYIEPFLNEEDRTYLQEMQGKIKVEFLDYDWGLNGHY